ncbi:MAG: hypothetical protein ABFC57_13720 [Veillonellales bacterium]
MNPYRKKRTRQRAKAGTGTIKNAAQVSPYGALPKQIQDNKLIADYTIFVYSLWKMLYNILTIEDWLGALNG